MVPALVFQGRGIAVLLGAKVEKVIQKLRGSSVGNGLLAV